MLTREPDTTFWVPEEAIRYTVRRVPRGDMFAGGVVVTREEDAEGNLQQALLGFDYVENQLTLRQVDGDLDVTKAIREDQRIMSWYPGSIPIWRRIWKVALGTK